MLNESEAVTFARGAADKRVARLKKVPGPLNLSARFRILLLSTRTKMLASSDILSRSLAKNRKSGAFWCIWCIRRDLNSQSGGLC